jgi:hypothetical protein
LNKAYPGGDGAKLAFTNDGRVMIAIITAKDGTVQQYVFLDHGATQQANVYGLYWTVANPGAKQP